ncbi:MAG: PBP1A family penicillin-binding protein [Alphaproteobacteria bacterium]
MAAAAALGRGRRGWSVVLVAGLVAWFAYDLPSIDDALAASRRPSMVIKAADGAVLASYGDYHGGALDYEELPDSLVLAVLATEDRRFFDHPGIDIVGVARAAVSNIVAGELRQGASTITQQLAKNLFLTPERTIRRKVQEALLALWLEHRFSKQQILAIYLNRVYFGAGTYGVEAASQRFFGHSARRLSLAESAILAGLLKAPSRFNPAADPDRAAARAATVLAGMVDAEFISAAQAADARAGVVGYADAGGARRSADALYFADWVAEHAAALVPADAGDLVIVTTLDRGLQAIAAGEVRATLAAQGAAARVGQAAVVMLAPDGAVRAMVGGRDYQASQYNRATVALRQPGSAFKPFVYLAALREGWRPDSMIDDSPVTIGGWSPQNYDGRFRGPVTLRQALAQSLNAATARLIDDVGVGDVRALAQRLGIASDLPRTPALALGAGGVHPLELVGAYAAIANGGVAVAPYGIVEIRDAAGRLLYGHGDGRLARQIDADDAAAMAGMLRAVVTEGSGRAAALPGVAVAGKTGTSSDYRDAWFVGFAGGLVAGVWLGNDDNGPMRSVTGGGLPAELWRDIMARALGLGVAAAQ